MGIYQHLCTNFPFCAHYCFNMGLCDFQANARHAQCIASELSVMMAAACFYENNTVERTYRQYNAFFPTKDLPVCKKT